MKNAALIALLQTYDPDEEVSVSETDPAQIDPALVANLAHEQIAVTREHGVVFIYIEQPSGTPNLAVGPVR